MSTVQINGQPREIASPAETPLLWVLRDELGMTGTKFGCGMALCGACTVHIGGVAARACVTPVSAIADQAVTTLEQMENDPVGRQVQQAWLDLKVAQCGYCQGGQIMSAIALLKTTPRPDASQIDDAMTGNLCRCGTYPRIRAAIELAATRLNGGRS